MTLSTKLGLTLVPLDHEPLGCFEDPPVPHARLLCCNDPHWGLYSKHQRGMCRRPPGGSKRLEVLQRGICAKVLAARPVSGPFHRSSSQPSPDWVIALCVAARRPPQRRAPVLQMAVADALASCLLKGLRVREGRVVDTLSALEAENAQEDSVMHRSEHGE